MRRLTIFGVVLLAVAGLAVAQASGGQRKPANVWATGSTMTRTPTASRPSRPMLHALARSLAGLHPRPLPRQVITAPRNLTVIPGPTTCEVAAAGCSLHPCLMYVAPQATASVYAPSVAVGPRSGSCRRSDPTVPVAAGA